MSEHIRLKMMMAGQANEGKSWESPSRLRIGRQKSLEIVLDDASVSRQHAEVFNTGRGWRVRDLKSTNGTFVNGNRITTEWPVRVHDILKCGDVQFVIDQLTSSETIPQAVESDELVVEAADSRSWEEALSGLAFDRNQCPRPGEQLKALLRAGHYLGHVENEEELLDSILNDAVGALDAQRGAIVMADEGGSLRLCSLATGRGEVPARPAFSQSLANRSFSRGESILCKSVEEDPELAMAQSIAEGAMSSVLCVLLRTPRKRLGVLHLDRGPMQKPFSRDDLHLADALAANVSAGIESAQLLQRQRDLFLSTIMILSQAVELRDDYTGGHTARVARYSELLARELKLTASDLNWIRLGTPLHDIGKIGIDDAILRKPGPLTQEEFRIMQSHTVKGALILGTIPDLAPIIPIVRSHHERWDGRGYPDAIAGEQIPRLARIVAVADTFDAMTSDRPYRKGMSPEVAFTEVEKQTGKQFDPECAAAFLRIKLPIIQGMDSRSDRTSLKMDMGTTMVACPT